MLFISEGIKSLFCSKCFKNQPEDKIKPKKLFKLSPSLSSLTSDVEEFSSLDLWMKHASAECNTVDLYSVVSLQLTAELYDFYLSFCFKKLTVKELIEHFSIKSINN